MKLSIFDKVKMSMLTDENKEKFLLEKEREAREKERKARKGSDSAVEEVEEIEESKPVVKDEKKKKKVMVVKRKKEEAEESDVVTEKSSESKVESRVDRDRVKYTDLLDRSREDSDVDDSVVVESKTSSVADELRAKREAEALNDSLRDLLGNREEVIAKPGVEEIRSESKDEGGVSGVDSVSDKVSVADEIGDDGIGDSDDAFLNAVRAENEAKRKAELVRKRELERAKYSEILINLPPGKEDVLLRYALDAGVPEWYLREIEWIADEIDFEEVASVIEDTVQAVEEVVNDVVVEDVEDVVSVRIVDGSESIEFDEDVPLEVETVEGAEVDVKASVELPEEGIPIENTDVTDTKVQASLLDRLKQIDRKRVTREVLKVDGDNVFVKEQVADRMGNLKSNYSNYKVTGGATEGIAVGIDLADDVSLERVESRVVIDGEDYDVSVEEEASYLKHVSLREIWVLSTDIDWVNTLRVGLEDTRYRVYPVRNERDFLMATRNVDNMVVVTQKLPEEARDSVVAYLKYLNEDRRNARLVSIASSPVNHPLIEMTFDAITVADLDSYYEEFTSDMYNFSKRPMREILKTISFDLSDIVGQGTITVEVDDADGVILGHEEVDLGDGFIEVDLEIDVNRNVEISLDSGILLEGIELDLGGSSEIVLGDHIDVEVERGSK